MDDLSLEFRQCVVGRETLFFCTKIYKCFDPFFNFFFDRYKQLVRCAVQTSVDHFLSMIIFIIGKSI